MPQDWYDPQQQAYHDAQGGTYFGAQYANRTQNRAPMPPPAAPPPPTSAPAVQPTEQTSSSSGQGIDEMVGPVAPQATGTQASGPLGRTPRPYYGQPMQPNAPHPQYGQTPYGGMQPPSAPPAYSTMNQTEGTVPGSGITPPASQAASSIQAPRSWPPQTGQQQAGAGARGGWWNQQQPQAPPAPAGSPSGGRRPMAPAVQQQQGPQAKMPMQPRQTSSF